MVTKEVLIKNRKAFFNYEILDKYIAGLVLLGTEIKSIRNGSVTLSNSFCVIENDELFVKGMNISEYSFGNLNNHETDRVRKLLLSNKEIKQIKKKVFEKKLSIIPTKLFVNDRGFAKIEIGLGKGKKTHDKREDIKKRDTERNIRDNY
ncbi:MAG: SsrA-binding protein [Bacteroidota bacterium]|jgi:SsrA-binding protein|nr:SsrA-binding protein [Bacteroidota bacterium]